MENNRFIDIHHHLSYGLDDGAQTFEDMQKMMVKAAAEGIGHLVCTTHVTPGHGYFNVEAYVRHVQKGQQWCLQQGLPLTLHFGSEILYTPSTMDLLRQGKLPTLAYSWTLLVEFIPDASFQEICDAVLTLGNGGYRVILAHVERYRALRKLECVQKLHNDYGAYMQMNTATILRKQSFFTQRWVQRMLDEGFIDIVATDAHNLTTRPCMMRGCFQVLQAKYGQEYAEKLCIGNARKLLNL